MLHIRRVYIIGCMYQSIQSLCTKRLRSGPSYEVKGVTFSQRRKKLLIISENIRCFFVISSPVCSTFYQSEVSNRKKIFYAHTVVIEFLAGLGLVTHAVRYLLPYVYQKHEKKIHRVWLVRPWEGDWLRIARQTRRVSVPSFFVAERRGVKVVPKKVASWDHRPNFTAENRSFFEAALRC